MIKVEGIRDLEKNQSRVRLTIVNGPQQMWTELDNEEQIDLLTDQLETARSFLRQNMTVAVNV